MGREKLDTLIEYNIQDLYSAEQQILDALPKLIKKVSSIDLRKSLELHLFETEKHVARLVELAKNLKMNYEGHECKGMKGILAENEESIKDADQELLDRIIIGGARRVEHYEIAGYMVLLANIKKARKAASARPLKQTLKEEEKADIKLAISAVTASIN